MISRKTLALGGGAVLVAAIAAAFLAPARRTVTTSSSLAYREYLAGQDEIHRMYMSDAQRHFEAALRYDPNFVMAMVSMASIRQTDPAAAKVWLARANAGRNRIGRRERLALDLMRAWIDNRLNEATRLAIVLKDDYHDERGYSFLGNVAAMHGQTEDANAIYREWLAVDPNNAFAYFFLAQLHLHTHSYDQAIAFADRAAGLSANTSPEWTSRAWALQGNAYEAAGRFADARQAYLRAVRASPNNLAAAVGLARTGGGTTP